MLNAQKCIIANLRFAEFSQSHGTQFWTMLFIVTAILSEITWCVRECPPWCSIVGATVTMHQLFCILHYYLTLTVHTFFRRILLISEWHLHIFLFRTPRNNPNKDSKKALVRKASSWSWKCQRGGGNIYIHTGFLSAFSFWKFQPKLYWIFNCDFWIWPLCTFTDRISRTRGVDTFWFMQWYQEVIAELKALNCINFHEVKRKLWEYELSRYFLFLLSIVQIW